MARFWLWTLPICNLHRTTAHFSNASPVSGLTSGFRLSSPLPDRSSSCTVHSAWRCSPVALSTPGASAPYTDAKRPSAHRVYPAVAWLLKTSREGSFVCRASRASAVLQKSARVIIAPSKRLLRDFKRQRRSSEMHLGRTFVRKVANLLRRMFDAGC